MLAPLIAHFSPAMRAVARRHLDLRHDIDDAVQDAWLQFTRGARLIRSPGAAGGWLCVTTKHAALTIARRRGRTVSLSCDFDLPAPQQPDGAVLREERTAVCAAIGRLPASERALVEMLFVARLPYEEVMERTGRPVGAIGPTRQRVLQKLRHDPAIRALAASL